MPRYFLELAYKGANYSGFQVQKNANTVQAEIEKALSVFYRHDFELTGSSRTDAGVNAVQNFFHFDFQTIVVSVRDIYHLNAILPSDIVLKAIKMVRDEAHCRFDALSRTYAYHLYNAKNPFLQDQAYFYPYPLDLATLNSAAAALLEVDDFTTFSKKNTQVHTFNCKLTESVWLEETDRITFRVCGDRFLRGMVRGLVGTMLRVGSGKISLSDFHEIINAKDCSGADFSVPGHALFLEEVKYPNNVFL